MNSEQIKHLIIVASPSGGGKSTICRFLLKKFPNLHFSVSATTREKRTRETNGKDYFFLSKEEFKRKIERGDLIEYEEIYGNYYGTLYSTVNKAIAEKEFLLFDIDVKGAIALQKAYPDESLLIFLDVPSMEVLEKRLLARSTETTEQIENRLSRAKMEIGMKHYFDYIIINEILDDTLRTVKRICEKYMHL
jgi:guanylate kinase